MLETLRSRAALVRAVGASLALVAILFVFVFPTRAYLAQRGRLQRERAQLSLLDGQAAKLQHDAHDLASDAEIERIARAQYDLVMPGEQAWVAVPEPPTTTTTAPPPVAAPQH